jgi:predicted metal-dependent hydrolase
MSVHYPAQVLRTKVYGWAIKMKVNPKDIRIQKMDGKWGSCTADGIVTFADDLLDQPSDFQDYVIVHELAHLKVKNHGKLFNSLVANYIQNAKDFENRVNNRALD